MNEDDLAYQLYHDFPTFARLCLKIETKKGKLEPFVLNDAQWIIWNEIKRQMDLRMPVRVIILKGRQQGCSTLAQGIAMWLACTREGFRAMSIAHKLKPAAQELFGKVELMYENLPEEIRAEVPLAPGRATGRRLKFDAPMRSLMVVESAEESDAVGRSGTFTFGHLTEIPFWKDPESTIAAFEACVPNEPETFIIVESTAQGIGNWFEKTWSESALAVREKRQPPFWPVFVPWYKQAEYRRRRTDFDHDLTTPERERMRRLGIDEEQILWYRDKMQKNGDLAQQEYPDTDRDAFLSSGMPFFMAKPLARHAEHAKSKPPVRKGRWQVRRERGKTKATFVQNPSGELWVWDTPRKGHRYVVSVDPSSGRAKDRSAYHVLDVTDPIIRQVASFHGMLQPDDLAIDSITTCRYYNNALWVPERNAVGERLVGKGWDDIGYTNVYRFVPDAKIGGKKQSPIVGWISSPKTRPWALEKLAEAIHNHTIEINCSRTIEECYDFVYLDANDERRIGAQPGRFDDLVMALAIGVAAKDQAGGDIGFEVWR